MALQASHLEDMLPQMQRQLAVSSNAARNVFREVGSAALVSTKATTVAYLGPPGDFSHTAALQHMGRSPSFQASDTIAEVFSVVVRGVCDYGIVPVENSSHGAGKHCLVGPTTAQHAQPLFP